MESGNRKQRMSADCPCRRNCELHGDCGACRERHSQPGAKYLPVCERPGKAGSKKPDSRT